MNWKHLQGFSSMILDKYCYSAPIQSLVTIEIVLRKKRICIYVHTMAPWSLSIVIHYGIDALLETGIFLMNYNV